MGVFTRVAMCAALSFGSLAACDRTEEPRPSTGSAARGSAEAPCAYVEARPTYLPWLDGGEEVPEPRPAHRNGTSYVMWVAGKGARSQQSVVFRRSSEPRGGLGERVAVELEGAPGHYYSAPGSSGSVLWDTGLQRCGLVTLAVSLPGAGPAEVRAEVLKIVESIES